MRAGCGKEGGKQETGKKKGQKAVAPPEQQDPPLSSNHSRPSSHRKWPSIAPL